LAAGWVGQEPTYGGGIVVDTTSPNGPKVRIRSDRMRLITTLYIGTAALLCVVAPVAAQVLRSPSGEPAVRALPTALLSTPASAPVAQAVTASTDLPPNTDLPPTTDAPAPDTASSATAPHPSATAVPAAPSTLALSSATVPAPSATSVPPAPAPAGTSSSAAVQSASAFSLPAAAPAPAPPTPVTPPSAAIDADITSSPNRNSIVATVNDTPISEFDLRQRVQLMLALDPDSTKLTAADLKRLRDDTLQQLEDEQVERDAAVKKHLTVSPVIINKTIDDLLVRNKMSHETLIKALTDKGSSEESLKDKYIAAEVWQKVVQEEFEDDVNTSISPAQIDDEMRRAAEGATKTHYEVLEIFMPSGGGPEQDEKVRQTVEGIVTQLHNGSTFADVAREYSRSPSAAAGGDIGWVYDGQLDKPLNDALSKMKRGDLSPPIKGAGGYYLLALRDRQEPLGTNVSVEEAVAPSGPPGTLPLARLSLPTVGASQEILDNVMKIAMQIQQNVPSCEDLAKVQKQLPNSVYTDLGNQTLADLSPEIQKALAATKSGEIAQPVVSPVGIEIIARCDKRAGPPRTAFTMPTREQVSVGLFQDRMATLARRYLSELRRDATIRERGADGQIVDAALATVH
jgi:peptidyl-prolyl cis-trans isomerase SurA